MSTENENTCSICLCAVDKTLALDIVCGHVFHEACLNQWFSHNHVRTCPLCRVKLLDEPQKRTVEETLDHWKRIGWTVTRVRDYISEFYIGRPVQETTGSMAFLCPRTGNVVYI